MAITLSTNFINELRKGNNNPNVVIEMVLDGGTRYYGQSNKGLGSVGVNACLGSVSSLQNRIDIESGYATRGEITFTIIGRDNFKTLIQTEHLKNRRVNRKDGFIADGFDYTTDYATTFTGRIIDWKRKGDELTITARDELKDDFLDIPQENATKTQYIDYQNTNPVDIVTNIITASTLLGVSTAYVNSTAFTTERDSWLNSWNFSRVLYEPQKANQLLAELQRETNSFIFHDGDKINYKVFSPPLPGQTIEAWNDNDHIIKDSLECDSGYKKAFCNRVVVYYDYDEGGEDNEKNYENVVIAVDAASQGSSEWDEVSTKKIKSKWIRSFYWSQPSNVTGVIIYHSSFNNGAGSGTLTYNSTNETLQWTAPGGSIGTAIKVTANGKYQVYDADQTKYIRVIVTYGSLPGGNQTDSITLTNLNGSSFATSIAQKILNRYRNPSSSVRFDIDLNRVAYNSEFIKPTDIKDITTDEAFEFGESSWATERVIITSVRPDFQDSIIELEAIETKQYRRYGFIAPAGYPDYTSATDAQKEYAFIGNGTNKVNGGTEDGYYIWALPWFLFIFLQIAQVQVFL